jgi:hypothetical protein
MVQAKSVDEGATYRSVGRMETRNRENHIHPEFPSDKEVVVYWALVPQRVI